MPKETEGMILSRTESLCPVCLKRIAANRVAYGEDVYLEKMCDDHGPFRVIVWRGSHPSYTSWRGAKLPDRPPVCDAPVDKGCPFDCGLCPDAGWRTESVEAKETAAMLQHGSWLR